MMTAFETLGLPVSLQLTEGEIKSAYTSLGAGAETLAARNTLLAPVTRLTAWMEAHGMPQLKHAAIPDSIIPLFSQMAQTLGEVKALHHKRQQATTFLTQTLLDKSLFEQRPKLDELSSQIDQLELTTLDTFTSVENTQSAELANKTFQTLKFVTKWRAELSTAYNQLLV